MKFPGYVDIDAYFISIMTLFLLYNQGSGKTTLAKKLARAWKCELINGKYSVMKVPLSLRNTKYKYPQLVMQHCFKFWVDVLHFSPCMINLSHTCSKNICCRLTKVVASNLSLPQWRAEKCSKHQFSNLFKVANSHNQPSS